MANVKPYTVVTEGGEAKVDVHLLPDSNNEIVGGKISGGTANWSIYERYANWNINEMPLAPPNSSRDSLTQSNYDQRSHEADGIQNAKSNEQEISVLDGINRNIWGVGLFFLSAFCVVLIALFATEVDPKLVALALVAFSVIGYFVLRALGMISEEAFTSAIRYLIGVFWRNPNVESDITSGEGQ